MVICHSQQLRPSVTYRTTLYSPSNATSVNARNNLPLDNTAVLVPRFAILLGAVLAVPVLAMDEQDGKVQHVEVGDWNGGARQLSIGTLSDDLFASENGAVDGISGKPGGQAIGP